MPSEGIYERFINFYTDFAFKKFFGTPANKEFLISFLNALLKLEGDEEIKDIVAVETPEYITPDDIEDVLDGTYEDTEPENPDISIGDGEYEAMTDDEILDLIETI